MSETTNNAIAQAYVEAHRIAADGVVGVAIHVSTEIGDYLKALATFPVDDGFLGRIHTLWGFPLVIEEHARPEHVSVRTVLVIA
jgi:hypothetical protein